MKKILLLILVCTILFKNADVTFIPVQSLFFVAALKKYGVFASGEKQKYSAVKPALLMLCGLCLSLLCLLYSGTEVLTANILYSVNAFSQYLLFYSVITFMYLYGKSQRFLRLALVLFTLFPCISVLSPGVPSVLFTFVMIVIAILGLIALGIYLQT